MSTFRKAVKRRAKGRAALIGPAGSGKSYTALVLATKLAEGKPIAAIDTEHGSLSKYADLFDFDVIEPESYDPRSLIALHKEAAEQGYGVFICDSLSHYWMGKDGALEFVDNAAKRGGRGDSFAGWKGFRPIERDVVDTFLASPMHVIVTMRTKNDYVEEVDERTGKKKRVKIGLAPVQREGLEYEFDLVGLMDDENTFIVDKTRCPDYARKCLLTPGPDTFEPFRAWLEGSDEPKPVPEMPAEKATEPETKPFVVTEDAVRVPATVREQFDERRSRGPAEVEARPEEPKEVKGRPFDFKQMLEAFAKSKAELVERLGETAGRKAYYESLAVHAQAAHANQVKTANGARAAWADMEERLRRLRAEEPVEYLERAAIEAEAAEQGVA